MKKHLVLVCTAMLCLGNASGKDTYTYKFQNPNLPVEERVNDLVSQLSLGEKIGQMMNNAPAIERLGIPAYNWWNEALHGVARSPYNVTSYPQAIAMASTWNPAELKKTADYTAEEGRAIYNDSKKKGTPAIFRGLTYWSPNINIFRDPRWGRGMETYGEDPYLTGMMGAAFVEGLQGNDPKYLKSSACAKHYAVHSGPEWNRHTYNAQISNQDLWDTYLPAFRKLIVDAKVTGVMCAYNQFLGEACCGNDLLMTDILKNQWHFTGYVTSDCGAIDDFYRTHKLYDDAASASADAVLHGTDCECGGSYAALADAVVKGLITEEQIDQSVKKLFEMRFRLGMFDPDNMVPYSSISLAALESDDHKAQALNMAHQSIVLMKNAGNLLPLDASKIKKIAVVGPNADDKRVLLSNYYGYPSKMSSVLDAIKAKVDNGVEVVYDKGVNLVDDYVFTSSYDASMFFNEKGKKGFNVKYFRNTKFESNPVLTRYEEKVDYKWGLGQTIGKGVTAENFSAIWSTTFKPAKSGEVCFEVSADDQASLYIDGVKQEKVGLINDYYLLNAEAGKTYNIEIRYIQYGDNAEVKFDMGTLCKADAKKVVSNVQDADVILFVGGISPRVEGEEMGVDIAGFKRGDRTSIALPAVQENMLKALSATGKPVVFVLMTGSAIGLAWEAENIPAIVNAWYGGQAGGEALADVLFGDYNPAGRLPITFYKDVDELPEFENYNMRNRTYRYFTGKPVYAFGHGLSYTTFEYADMTVTAQADKSLKVKATVTNTGKRDGDEVVQLYVSNKRNFATPIRSLKGFDRISLKAGESKTVEFTLTADDLSLVNASGYPIPMEGKVTLSVGGGQPSQALLDSKQCLVQTIDY